VTPIVTYDREADAAYIRLSDGPVRESEQVANDIVLDFDADGRIVGLEILDAHRHLSPDLLEQAA
jgi:uncharacterized protein YuzE